MPTRYWITAAVASALFGLAAIASSAAPPPPGAPVGTSLPVYLPPMRGAPKTRVGGGTRGPNDRAPTLHVLAPEHTGWTTLDRPVLYWYLSQPAQARIEVTLADDSSVLPLLETAVTNIVKPGIQQLRLEDYGIRLQPGVEYQWSIALVQNPEQRSQDVVASAGIRMIDPDAALKAAASQCRELDCVKLYAERGVWYDALDQIESLIRLHPDQPSLTSTRTQLLKQVALPDLH
jgi:hypothetical protein